MRYAAPEGLADDCVMALALAWVGLGTWRQQPAEKAWFTAVAAIEPSSLSRPPMSGELSVFVTSPLGSV
jgi:hypothetical protein